MLTGVTLVACAVDAQDRYLAALSGVAFIENAGGENADGITLVVASAGENALTRLALEGDTLVETGLTRLSAHAGLHDIADGPHGPVALARWDAGVTIDAAGAVQDGAHGLVALSGSASATRGESGFTLNGRHVADTAAVPLGDVTALAMLEDGRVIAGSAFDTGIALVSATDGILDVALAGDGFWHNRVSAIETLRIGGTEFAIVAASGSSSLSVFEVAGDELILTDHEWDSMMTRFSGVSELATVQVGGMTVVAAGGADAGLSLFELTEEGDLVHLRDIVDTRETPLDGIGGIDMTAHGDGALLAVTSGRDHGVALFELEFEFATSGAVETPDLMPAPVHALPPLELEARFSAAPLVDPAEIAMAQAMLDDAFVL